MSLKKTADLNLQITSTVVYVEAQSVPTENKYFFAYKISIKNLSNSTAQLLNRHWIITDGLGHIEEVKGPGVVGLQPKINVGQTFEYDSACPLNTSSGSMKGFYQFINDEGDTFEVEIPEFFLIAPQALN
jgi:ApaG protein